MPDEPGDDAVTIGIVAGEASGDALGADLVAAVRSRLPEARFVGVGGPRLEAAGCEVWQPMSRLSLRGYSEVVHALPGLFRLRADLVRRLPATGARLFIGIDAPDFNLGLEARLKRRGLRTIHYVSPSVWAWRNERTHTLARSADRLLTLFPFEPALYAGTGLAVTFVGHPLASAAAALNRRDTRELLRLDANQPVFALLPGSRMLELEMHSELLLDAAVSILEQQPVAQFLVPLVSRETREYFETILHRKGLEALPLTILYGHADQALSAADIGLVASGTATLEAALSGCPHAIFYRVKELTARMVARKLLLPWVGLPNVLAGRYVVPEFLQQAATAANLARAALNLFDDRVTRRRLEALFATMARSLTADTPARVADAVVAELELAGVPC